jgi:hypothetical protein
VSKVIGRNANRLQTPREAERHQASILAVAAVRFSTIARRSCSSISKLRQLLSSTSLQPTFKMIGDCAPAFLFPQVCVGKSTRLPVRQTLVRVFRCIRVCGHSVGITSRGKHRRTRI